jgi:YVTN family beta-propeller protein
MIQLLAVNAMAEPVNTYVYISTANTVSVLDPITNSRVADIVTDYKPDNVVLNPSGTMLYVTFDNSKYLWVYSALDYSGITRIQLRDSTTSMYAKLALSDDGRRLYVSLRSEPKIILIDTTMNTITKSITPSCWVGDIYYYDGYLYASEYDVNGGLKKYDPDLNLVSSVDSASFNLPSEIALDKANTRLVVANENGTLTGVSLSTFTATGMYNTGTTGAVRGVAVNSTGVVYATRGTNSISLINAGYTIIANYTVGTNSQPVDVICNPYNNTLYVTGYGDNKLYVVNADTGETIASGNVGNQPYRLAIGTQSNPVSHQVKFVVQSLFGIIKYSNATVTIFDENGNLQYTKQTDLTGQVAYYLQPTSTYTIWVYSQKDNINISYPIVPYDDTYYVEVVPFIQSWNPLGWIQNTNQWTGAGTGNVNKDIRITNTINTTSSPRKMTVNYTDATASTTSINFTLLRYWYDNHTYTTYNTTIVAGSSIGSRQMPFTIPANLADGQSWRLVVTSETGAYGTVMRSDDYRFPGASYPIPGLPASWYPYLCFAFTVIVALMFTYISTGLGLIVIAALNIIFMGMGWLAWSDVYLLLMQVLAVFGAGQIFKMRKQREGV